MTRPLRAITVWQPYAGLLAIGAKLPENRTWAPPDGSLRPGEHIAIHAGSKYDIESWEHVSDLRVDLAPLGRWNKQREAPWPLKSGKPKFNPDAEDDPTTTPYCAIIGVAVLDEVRTTPRMLTDASGAEYVDPFWCGPVGWYLRDPVPIAPVFCKGAQGLWFVCDPALSIVRERYKAAKGSP